MHLVASIIVYLLLIGSAFSTDAGVLPVNPTVACFNLKAGPVKRSGTKPLRQKAAVRKSRPKKPGRKHPTSAKTRRSTHSVKKRHSASPSAKPLRKTTVRTVSKTLAIMGRRYATIPILDNQLSGAVYYLASGHGGPDPGAIGKYGSKRLPEDEYAYDVTIRLARVLIQHGATVYMIVQDHNDGIRDGAVLPIDYDERAYPNQAIPLDQTTRLRQTTTAVNRQFASHKERYQRFVTIHVDSRSKGETIDVFFYHHPQSKVGLRLARNIHRMFQANYKRYRPARPYMGRVSSRGSLYVIRNSQAPTVFIELGNIQNQLDQRRFLLAENRQALANWLCQGMVVDYKKR
ncbi:N-acetylmuramoyl-L-alanine amidase family protein [Spirosoma horti]